MFFSVRERNESVCFWLISCASGTSREGVPAGYPPRLLRHQLHRLQARDSQRQAVVQKSMAVFSSCRDRRVTGRPLIL